MEELIEVRKSKGGKQIVSARELHKFLEVGTDFTNWCKRMFEYGFENNIDYAVTKIGEPDNQVVANPNPKVDYAITLNCAKEIAMIQRTDKGKIARQYFIECERKLKEGSIPQTYAQALLEAGRLALELEQKEKLLIEMKPKADFFDAVTDSKDAIDIGTVAKVLDMGIGRNKLFELLREKDILMKGNVPKQAYIDNCWFRVIEQKYEKADGSIHINIKTLVFQKGVNGIRKLITKSQKK